MTANQTSFCLVILHLPIQPGRMGGAYTVSQQTVIRKQEGESYTRPSKNICCM